MKIKIFENKATFPFFWLGFLIVFTTACEQTGANKADIQLTETKTPTRVVIQVVQSEPVILGSFKEMTGLSDVIAIVEFISKEGIINTAREHEDFSKPDPSAFSIGQVYKARVARYLKGSGDETIYIVQGEGFILTKNTPTTQEIEEARNMSKILAPRLQVKYLVFLRDTGILEEGYADARLFTGVAHPWKFEISDANQAIAEDELERIQQLFPPRPLSEVEQEIRQPAGKTPPPPQAATPTPFISTPYPGP